jgi:predicted flap endonuclease-1-like 5' DNA nuclease
MAGFTPAERDALLAVKGVGPTILSRLQEIGINSFDELAGRDAHGICATISATLGASCWRNSPQARAAISAAISRAGEPI